MEENRVPISTIFENVLIRSKKNLSKVELINTFMLTHHLAGINIRLMLEDIYDAYKKDKSALQERSKL